LDAKGKVAPVLRKEASAPRDQSISGETLVLGDV
jgi:hypothetical protein